MLDGELTDGNIRSVPIKPIVRKSLSNNNAGGRMKKEFTIKGPLGELHGVIHKCSDELEKGNVMIILLYSYYHILEEHDSFCDLGSEHYIITSLTGRGRLREDSIDEIGNVGYNKNEHR